MAYISGLITPEEKATLERRGWEVEPAPTVLMDDEETTPWSGDENFRENSHGDLWAMVWVDNSMFNVMSGPDWDTKEDSNDGTGRDSTDEPGNHQEG